MREGWLVASALALCGLAGGSASAQTFDSMTAFGDSLSDNGNFAALLHLPRARFTTNSGLTAVEGVAAHYGLTLDASLNGGTNYAYGGAGVLNNEVGFVPSLPAQVATYLASNPTIGANTLISFWGGGNDVLFHSAAIDGGHETRADAEASLIAAAQLEGEVLGQLQAAGARTIIVFNVPDVGVTPGASPQDTGLSQTFNAELNAQLDGREGIVPVNVYGLVRELVADPSHYGLTNVTSAACTVANSLLCTPSTLVEPNADQSYLFADGVHPTSGAHASLTRIVVSEMSAPGQMSLLAEAPFALLRHHDAAVRQGLSEATALGGHAFVNGRVGERSFDADTAAPASDSDDDGVTFGGVWRSGDSLALGSALSYGQSRVRVGDSVRFDAKTLFVSVFGRGDWSNGVWLAGRAGLGATDYDDVRRSFQVGTATRTENASASGADASAEVSGGRRFDLGAFSVGPFAALGYDRVEVDAFAEASGDSTAMRFGRQTREASVGRLGLDLGSNAPWAGLTISGRVSYANDFSSDGRAVSAGLTGMNGVFAMAAYQASEDWVEADLGVSARLGDALTACLSYAGAWSDKGDDNSAALSVSMPF